MNKKQLMIVGTAIIFIAVLFGLNEMSVMYKQPGGQLYDRWELTLYGIRLGDFFLLAPLYLCLVFKGPVVVLALICSLFLIYIFRNKHKRTTA